MMIKAIFAATAVAALIVSMPVSAQVFFSNDPAADDGSEAAAVPAYGQNAGQAFGYAPRIATACRTVRERSVAPQEHVTFRTHRICS